jgi:hypothetical protein
MRSVPSAESQLGYTSILKDPLEWAGALCASFPPPWRPCTVSTNQFTAQHSSFFSLILSITKTPAFSPNRYLCLYRCPEKSGFAAGLR